MNNEMKQAVIEKMSKAIVKMATRTAQMPNQCCPFFLGKPNAEIELCSKDFRDMASTLKS